MDRTESINKIKELLSGFLSETKSEEVELSEVKLSDVKLKDGTKLVTPDVELMVGSSLSNEDGSVVVDGEYVLEDGSIAVVAGGFVTELKPVESAVEVADVSAAVEVEVEDTKPEDTKEEPSGDIEKRVSDLEKSIDEILSIIKEQMKMSKIAMSKIKEIAEAPGDTPVENKEKEYQLYSKSKLISEAAVSELEKIREMNKIKNKK